MKTVIEIYDIPTGFFKTITSYYIDILDVSIYVCIQDELNDILIKKSSIFYLQDLFKAITSCQHIEFFKSSSINKSRRARYFLKKVLF